MIQEISIQNFLSFREKQTISFVATADKKISEELTWETKPGGTKLLRMAMIYGANASGKSNLLLAIQTLWEMLITAYERESTEISFYQPFELTRGEPTQFEITFWANNRRFQYELTYNNNTILYEKMMYSSDKDVLSLMYERKKGEIINFGTTVGVKAKQRDDLNKDTLNNHTLLSTLNKRNINVPPVMRELYEWIKSNVHQLDTYNSGVKIAEQAIQNPPVKKMLLELLSKADFNIVDFSLIEMSLPEEILNSNMWMVSEPMANYYTQNKKQLVFTHQTKSGNFHVNFNNESAGTKVYFRLARLLFELKNNTCIMMIDEIEDSLHYDLLVHYLQMFLQTDAKSQLIFTTHNQMLLDEDWMIRRDMVWLAEKDRNLSSTSLYRASDMGIHKNVSLMNAYKIGKLGAKPLLGSTYFNPEEL